MRAEISNHLRMQNAKKRRPLEKNVSLETENIQNKTSEKSPEQKLMEAETLAEILESLTELQRKITGMKMDGYENKEIFLILDMMLFSILFTPKIILLTSNSVRLRNQIK